MSELIYISIKTQARRLKYFSIALKLLSKEGLQKQIFSNFLIEWSKQNHSSFLEYKSPSGEIILPEGRVSSNSLNSYYKALVQLDLIIEQGNFIIPTKTADVLNVLSTQYNELKKEGVNSYELNLTEKCFFLSVLIEKDYDIIILVLKMVYEFPANRLDFYLDKFQYKYLERVERKLLNSKLEDASILIESLQRISSWRQAKKYSEEYVPQRINWLIDLGFLDEDLLEDKKYKLTKKAKTFLLNLETNSISEREFNTFDKQWFYDSFSSSLADLYYNGNEVCKWENIDIEKKNMIIDECLGLSIKQFSVLGIPRAPAKSTLLLSSLIMLTKYFTVANYKEIVKWVEINGRINNRTYLYRGAEREGESYFILNNE